MKNRRRTDRMFRLNSVMRTAIWSAIKKDSPWNILLPYSLIQLEKHLAKTLPEGYTWKDFMQGKLHIDHILPIAIFRYKKPEDLDFQICWGLDNLRLLPIKENLKKGTKLIIPFQKTFPINIKIKKRRTK